MEKVVIDVDKCKGCGLCVDVCPKHCLAMGDTFNKTGCRTAVLKNNDACVSCGFCFQICPDTAIEIYR